MSRKKRMNIRLKKIREMLALNQQNFAERTGISKRALQNYEAGKREIPAKLIKALSEQMNVSVRWLMHGEGTPFGTATKEPAALNYSGLMEWMDAYPCSRPLPAALKAAILNHFNGVNKMEEGGGGNRWSGDHGINVVGDKNLINGD